MDAEKGFMIEEVTTPHTPYAAGMAGWLAEIFPEYLPPRFAGLLEKLRRDPAHPQIQIFVAITNGQVAGLAQMLYQPWQGSLLAGLDLLGVRVPYRRRGIAEALVQHCLAAAPETALQWQLPLAGLATLIDPNYPPIIQLHQKLGGQVRRDCPFYSGDIIAWYPLAEGWAEIGTPALSAQFEQFGRLLAVEPA